jgi:hypothetical protein
MCPTMASGATSGMAMACPMMHDQQMACCRTVRVVDQSLILNLPQSLWLPATTGRTQPPLLRAYSERQRVFALAGYPPSFDHPPTPVPCASL